MNIIGLISIVLLVVNILLLILLLLRRSSNNEIFYRINSRLHEFEKGINNNIDTNKQELERTKDIISENTKKTIQMIGELSGTIARLTDEQKHATKLTEDLKYLFQKPKARGNYTQIILEEMLERVLPKGIWHSEYNISGSGTERVDFALEYNSTIIPIDVKFPTDDYNRYIQEIDELKREALWKEFIRKMKSVIKSIGEKYIMPQKGTSEFAIMFIPTDSIYFDAISQENSDGFKNDLFEFSQERKVLIAGPSTFYAFLQIIITGLRNIEIYKNTKQLLENIKKLERNLEYFSSKYDDVGSKLQKAVESYDISRTHYSRIKKNAEEILQFDDSENNNQKEL